MLLIGPLAYIRIRLLTLAYVRIRPLNARIRSHSSAFARILHSRSVLPELALTGKLYLTHKTPCLPVALIGWSLLPLPPLK